jgi:hypothetical protein
MLLAMTSRLVCWAFMPVAAMASAFMTIYPSARRSQIAIRLISM